MQLPVERGEWQQAIKVVDVLEVKRVKELTQHRSAPAELSGQAKLSNDLK
ncbi:hypothetical protein PQR62_18260 [Herbaspirillum lusitanum]|uniref:Uncharacterized protein n=1 Tax=Herbaspirillum lusitanum TaxID=213312 RepID=A0ABW9AD34_9BURK